MDQAKYGLRFESGEVLPKGGLADLSACVLYILKEWRWGLLHLVPVCGRWRGSATSQRGWPRDRVHPVSGSPGLL